MYAIISASGAQFKVEEGQLLDIDLLEEQAGSTIVFDRVLAVSNGENLTVGQPTVAGASVTAEVVGVEQGPKLVIQKFRRRKNSRRRTGHRQMYTRVKITKISAN